MGLLPALALAFFSLSPDEPVYPSATNREASAEVLAWEGWQYRKGPSTFPGVSFAAVGNWRQIAGEVEPAQGTTTWRTRVVVFLRTDSLDTLADGSVRQRRSGYSPEDRKAVAQAIDRWVAWVSSQTGGALSIKAEVSFESETVGPTEPNFATGYLGARINGGAYEAEDKVFRGPYNDAVLIFPAVDPSVDAQRALITGTPTSVICAPPPIVAGQLERRLADEFADHVAMRATLRGFRLGGAAPLRWADVASTADLTVEELKGSLGKAFEVPQVLTAPPSATGWRGAFTPVEIVSDPDRGGVLKYVERGLVRNGGLELPVDATTRRLEGDGQSLSVMVKSTSVDPLAVMILYDDGSLTSFSLGRETNLGPVAEISEAAATSFTPDGTWQRVLIPVGDARKIKSVTVRPSWRSGYVERQGAPDIEYFFDDFTFTTEAAPSPSRAAIAPVDEKCAQAVRLGKSGQPSEELRTLLAGPEEPVVINALVAYQSVIDPLAEPGLIGNLQSYNPRRAELAIRALDHQGSPAALEAIRKALNRSPLETTKAAAASCLAARKVPGLQADLVALISSPGWQPRIETARALGSIEGPSAGIIMMSYLAQDDPELKLTVTELADPKEEYEMRKLLWSAVNEPFDAVRLASASRLVESPNPQFASQGYQAVRDDSIWVRREWVKRLGSINTDGSRAALRLATTDTAPSVRVLAVEAFGKFPGEVSVADLERALSDPHPGVQRALLQVSKARNVKLPEATINLFRNSFDPEVVSMAKAIG